MSRRCIHNAAHYNAALCLVVGFPFFPPRGHVQQLYTVSRDIIKHYITNEGLMCVGRLGTHNIVHSFCTWTQHHLLTQCMSIHTNEVQTEAQ